VTALPPTAAGEDARMRTTLRGSNNKHVFIGKENDDLSADGDLTPAHKNQPPPDPRNFDEPAK
jgi:hypothetical protein